MRILGIHSTQRSIGACLASAAFAALLAGCSNDNPPPQTPPTAQPTTIVTTPAPPASPPGTPVANSGVPQTNNTNAGPGGATGNELGEKVTEAIHINTQMTGSRVTAVADPGGVIRLTGTAQNQQQKALAEREARNTAGVASVINKIEIVPTGGTKVASQPKVIEKTTKVYVIQKPASSGANAGSVSSSSSDGTSGAQDQSGTGSTGTDGGGQSGAPNSGGQ